MSLWYDSEGLEYDKDATDHRRAQGDELWIFLLECDTRFMGELSLNFLSMHVCR